MARRRQICKYTPIGKRIAALLSPQYKLGRLLGLSQQTISKKLRGETAILLSDLEKLARRLKVPIGLFFGADEQACRWKCECGHEIVHTYAALVDVGTPICMKCENDMELAGE